ncbi:MAP3K12-binding inhibitory protein 1 [Liparis tanakae]|uniref:MAP3K12-binding inhibitory protein 1 n=1 Tax=Liparis tanakae TaxID=230148 RepID=A0A4Z2J4L0_9TELE|nr:MAP3K12-binding inhibitory protein 1 [Liparis tanakae]
MAETMKLTGNYAPPNDASRLPSYRDCVCAVLKLLSGFGKELKLSDAALRIEVSIDAVDLPSSPDSRVYACLQQHVTQLQAVSESLKTLVEAHRDAPSTEDDASVDAVASLPLREPTPSEYYPSGPEDAERKTTTAADDVMIQIRARKSEIERRISAFMERKQMEINENNVREFCNVIDCNQVTRVVNTYGPQTRSGGGGAGPGEAGEQQRGPMARDCGNAAIEERLHNIENHLKLPTAGPVPLSVYQRLKKLEDRILELEGLSPEYFQSTAHLHKRPKTSPAQACSLTELDEKIIAVKAALLKRVNEFECPL